MNKQFADFLNRHARAIVFFFALIALSGGLAYTKLASDVYPNLTFPRIAVIATTGDAAPERALLSTTRILEEAAGQVYHVRRVRSKTIRGSSELSVEFEDGTDLTAALHQLQARIAEVQNQLPAGVALTIEPVTPAIFPVMSFNVTTDKLSQADLYSTCRYQLIPPLSRVAGVARAQIQGGDLAEVAVQADVDKLKNFHLSISTIADALGRINQMQVLGRLDIAHQQNQLVAQAEADNIEQLQGTIIGAQAGQPVYLKDVASVGFGHKDRLSLVSVRQKRAIVVNVFKQPTASVVAVARAVREELTNLARTLPDGITIEPAYNESALVISALNNVFEAIEIGIALIIVVLFFFLRSVKSTGHRRPQHPPFGPGSIWGPLFERTEPQLDVPRRPGRSHRPGHRRCHRCHRKHQSTTCHEHQCPRSSRTRHAGADRARNELDDYDGGRLFTPGFAIRSGRSIFYQLDDNPGRGGYLFVDPGPDTDARPFGKLAAQGKK